MELQDMKVDKSGDKLGSLWITQGRFRTKGFRGHALRNSLIKSSDNSLAVN